MPEGPVQRLARPAPSDGSSEECASGGEQGAAALAGLVVSFPGPATLGKERRSEGPAGRRPGESRPGGEGPERSFPAPPASFSSGPDAPEASPAMARVRLRGFWGGRNEEGGASGGKAIRVSLLPFTFIHVDGLRDERDGAPPPVLFPLSEGSPGVPFRSPPDSGSDF